MTPCAHNKHSLPWSTRRFSSYEGAAATRYEEIRGRRDSIPARAQLAFFLRMACGLRIRFKGSTMILSHRSLLLSQEFGSSTKKTFPRRPFQLYTFLSFDAINDRNFRLIRVFQGFFLSHCDPDNDLSSVPSTAMLGGCPTTSLQRQKGQRHDGETKFGPIGMPSDE